jgi:hypothetical protein
VSVERDTAAACARCGADDVETRYSVAAQAVLCLRCYCRLPTAQYRPPSTPPVKLRRAPAPTRSPYTRFVYRIWDRLEQRTGHSPTYLDARHIASYCPRCLDGTLRIGFAGNPPTAFVSSNRSEVIAWGEAADPFLATELERLLDVDELEPEGGPGRCSRGCTEAEIVEALFG